LVSEQGVLIRIPVASIRQTGRSTQGVQLMNLDEKDRVAAVAQIDAKEDDEE
jgi:DNA gyrase subunit A